MWLNYLQCKNNLNGLELDGASRCEPLFVRSGAWNCPRVFQTEIFNFTYKLPARCYRLRALGRYRTDPFGYVSKTHCFEVYISNNLCNMSDTFHTMFIFIHVHFLHCHSTAADSEDELFIKRAIQTLIK